VQNVDGLSLAHKYL